MKVYFVFLLFCISLPLLAQHVSLIENGEKAKPENVDSFLSNLYTSNDYVISFRLRLSDTVNEKSDYFVLLKNAKILSAYNYSANSKNLKPLNLTVKSLQLVWDTFIQNDLFTMKNESDIPLFCLEKYRIYNSFTYEFVLLNNGKMKKLSYYDPEYYDNLCYGMAERQKIINSVAVITHVLTQ